ncbi:TM2 domain-containing protein [Asticcacaulis sp. ZE23SCel15]|uniref:TM2 domain-containing protein n=1 Tax=Asticcacaulis sp. ZE23SCel15 TaxID=3059027 RepID=UPI00265ED86B|nr:TM2 domain-containing protein [Asticcacaulis sp. ZE23SCel15]WKL56593.1 TM2 domain-containing protein [Asticcacaulis sp. ZE23SCel15]
MRGKVLSYDDSLAQGLISGDDGVRYGFTRADLMGGTRSVATGSTVDFEAFDGRAVSVYVVSTGLSDKNKWVAALLTFFFGIWGVHKFYLGKNTAGVIMLVCGTVGWFLVIPGIAVALISFIELIIYLLKSEQQFHEDYVAGDRSWF